MDWWDEVIRRLEPATGDVNLTAAAVWTVLAGSLLVVAVEPLWRVLRIAVTLVHELGHAVVGMAVGRRFTGFVLRGDMSGHAVTVGRARGVGRVVSTWAGYPAPALIGAAMAWVAGRGWAAAFIGGVLVILLIALIRVRSALTLFVMLVALAATACPVVVARRRPPGTDTRRHGNRPRGRRLATPGCRGSVPRPIERPRSPLVTHPPTADYLEPQLCHRVRRGHLARGNGGSLRASLSPTRPS